MTTPTYAHKMRFNVAALGPKDSVLVRWPELSALPALNEHGNDPSGDRWLRYCLLMTDPQSPLHTEVPDWEERKERAIKLAGLMAGADTDCAPSVAMRYALLRYVFQSRKMTAYLSLQEAFVQSCRKLEAEIEGGATEDTKADAEMRAYDLRGKLSDQIDRWMSQLDRYEMELFADDEKVREQALHDRTPQARAGSIEAKIFNRGK